VLSACIFSSTEMARDACKAVILLLFCVNMIHAVVQMFSKDQ
jgi:hypothetical protein